MCIHDASDRDTFRPLPVLGCVSRGDRTIRHHDRGCSSSFLAFLCIARWGSRSTTSAMRVPPSRDDVSAHFLNIHTTFTSVEHQIQHLAETSLPFGGHLRSLSRPSFSIPSHLSRARDFGSRFIHLLSARDVFQMRSGSSDTDMWRFGINKTPRWCGVRRCFRGGTRS